MTLDEKAVARIATLARIKVPDTALRAVGDELSQILAWIEQLAEVDTTGVAPMVGVEHLALPWRADVVTDGGRRDEILRNAPEAAHGFFTVPKVVE